MNVKGTVFKYGDNVDTDVIIPARYLNTSDPRALAAHCMEDIDTSFVQKVKSGDIMVAGWNFGCGSSREHAPLAIKTCGISVVIAKSFARIHAANLINAGILPLTFKNEADYDKVSLGDKVELSGIRDCIVNDKPVIAKMGGQEVELVCELSGRQKDILLAGGLLNYTKESVK